MNEMNGHPYTIIIGPYTAVEGPNMFPVNADIIAELTNKQISYLRHLQRGNALYDDGHGGYSEDVSEVISAVQKQGYDIETTRKGFRRGKETFSHRIRHTDPKVSQVDVSAPLPDLLSLASNPAEPIPEPQAPMQQRRRKYTRRSQSYDIVKGHLLAEKIISPREALERYGLTIGSLTAVISRLRNEDKWQIATVRSTKGGENKFASYRLEDAQSVSEIHPADTDLKPAASCPFAKAVNLNLGKNAPETKLMLEDGPDIKLIIKLRPDQLQYLSMTLKCLSDEAVKA